MNMIPMPPAAQKVMLQWAETLLLANGAQVSWPAESGEWLAPVELWERLVPRPTRGAFQSRLAAPSCPHFAARRSASGRLLALRPTPELEAYLARPNQPGRAL